MGGESPQMGRRSLLSKSGPAGKGGGCGARTSDAISSQGTIKVAALPGGPGCLQRSLHPRRLLPPAWAARPGYEPLGSCCLVSCTPVSGSLLFHSVSPSSLFFLPLSFSLSPSASVSPMFFLFPLHFLPFSPYLSTFQFPSSLFSVPFFSDAFFVSLIFFLYASLFLFLFHPLPSGSSCVSLSTPKTQQLRDERALHYAPEKVGPTPLRESMEPTWSRIGEEGVQAGQDWCLSPGLVGWSPGLEVVAPCASYGLIRISYCPGISFHCPIH